MPTMRQQRRFLGGRWTQPITGHPTKLIEHAFDRHSTRRRSRPGSVPLKTGAATDWNL
jgi:hypothetical protein